MDFVHQYGEDMRRPLPVRLGLGGMWQLQAGVFVSPGLWRGGGVSHGDVDGCEIHLAVAQTQLFSGSNYFSNFFFGGCPTKMV